jgi:hypothetical protein
MEVTAFRDLGRLEISFVDSPVSDVLRGSEGTLSKFSDLRYSRETLATETLDGISSTLKRIGSDLDETLLAMAKSSFTGSLGIIGARSTTIPLIASLA